MSKRRGTEGKAPLDPDDVLAGRAHPTAAQLLDLIHRVNPTGRELGAREAELRYRQKSRLQSLLVRRFAAELLVVPDPDHEGTISLRHRGHGRDGCHAVIAALDEDARAWVQLQVDLGTEPPAEDRPPAERPSRRELPTEATDEDDETPEALMRRAAEATDAYDYEAAREHLTRAVASSGRAPGPVAALLELLVETLGDDAAALALEATLPRATLAEPSVRGPLALAAARSGEEERARVLLRGVDDRRAAGVLAALAAAALTRRDLAGAEEHLTEVRRRDPTHPALAGVAAEIARARAEARGPAEAEIAALLAAGSVDLAEEKARAVLARWPESEAARRAVRAHAEQHRRAEMERLAQAAEAALAAGDPEAALARLGQALAAARGTETEGIERRMRAIEAAERARREADEARRVLARMAEDLREGLLAYLDLDETTRSRVRAEGKDDTVRLLDLATRGAPRARVEAVLALVAARRVAATDPEAVVDLLTPHLAVLERVPEARALVKDAEARLAARRAAHAEEQLALARAALAAGRAAEALQRLDDAALRDLPERDRPAAEALRAEAAKVVERGRREADVARLAGAGQLFEARALASELAAASEGEARDRWEAERRALQEQIQRAFHVEINDEPRILESCADMQSLVSFSAPMRWLTPDASVLILAEARGRRVLVRAVRHEDRTLVAEVLLQTPDPLGMVAMDVCGNAVWLAGQRGVLLALALDTWEVRLYRAPRDLIPAGALMRSPVLASSEGTAAPRFFWNFPANDEQYWDVQVIDLERRKATRTIAGLERMAAISGAREARVGAFKERSFTLCDERGAPVPGGRVEPPGATPVSAALHPDGRRLLVVVHMPAPDGSGEGLALVEAPLDGPARPPVPIDDAEGGAYATVACARDAQIVALVLRTRAGAWELRVLSARGDGLVPLYRTEVPEYTLLVQDAGARRLLLHDLSHRNMLEIGEHPPELPESACESTQPTRWIPQVMDEIRCIGTRGMRAGLRADRRDELRDVSVVALGRQTRMHQKRYADNPEMLVEQARSLEGGSPAADAEAARLRAWLWDKHPTWSRVRVLHADDLARDGRWQEVREVIDGCTPQGLADDADNMQHALHLYALSMLHLGHEDDARDALRRARKVPGACALEALDELLAPPDPDATAPLTQLVACFHAADACLAADDALGARDAIFSLPVMPISQMQVLARLAEICLRMPPEALPDRFRTIMSLERFLEAHASTERRNDLPVPGATWNAARLDDLAARARAWLETHGG